MNYSVMELKNLNEKYKDLSLNGRMWSHLNKTLKTLIESLVRPDRLRQDLIVTILLLIMEENGFLQLKDVDENAITVKDYILSRNAKGILKYETVFILKTFPDTAMKMIVSPLDDTVLINATIPDMHKETYSLCLRLGRYIINSELGMPSSLANLGELFILFKDKVVTPIKSGILNCHSYPSGNLSGLPEDVLLLIILKLPLKDVLSLSKSCRRLYRVVNEDRVWCHLYVRDFGERKYEGSWCDVYKEAYMSRSEARVTRNVDSFEFAVLPNYRRNISDSRWEVIL